MRKTLVVSTAVAVLLMVGLLGAMDAQAQGFKTGPKAAGELKGFVETELLHVETCEDSVPPCLQYEVNSGDTLMTIAGRYDLVVNEIIDFNPQLCDQKLPRKFVKTNPCEFIRAGTRLLLPVVSLPESRVVALEAVVEAQRDLIRALREEKQDAERQLDDLGKRFLWAIEVSAQMSFENRRSEALWRRSHEMIVFLWREKARLAVENSSLRFHLEKQAGENSELLRQNMALIFKLSEPDRNPFRLR